MSMMDEMNALNPQTLQGAKPTREKASREGYFDWNGPYVKRPDPNNKDLREVTGVILPPYPGYLGERVAAAKAGLTFHIPFYLNVSRHAIGSKADKNKAYMSCPRDLLHRNRVGTNDYPMLPADLVTLIKQADANGHSEEDCEICKACWDIVHPKAEIYKANKESQEFKYYSGARRQLSPQQQSVVNFLPEGTDAPLVFEQAKTLADELINFHYDQRQPDLILPFNIGAGSMLCTWVTIQRHEKPDTTTYTFKPIYMGTPHVLNSARQFDEVHYKAIVAKAKDLRELAREYVPDASDKNKAIAKKDALLIAFGLAQGQAQDARLAQSTMGMPAASSVSAPPMAVGPAQAMPMQGTPMPTPGPTQPPAAGAPGPVMSAPTSTLPAGPATGRSDGPAPIQSAQPPPAAAPLPAAGPAMIAPGPAAAPISRPMPSANQTPDADDAMKLLENLIGDAPGQK